MINAQYLKQNEIEYVISIKAIYLTLSIIKNYLKDLYVKFI